MTNATTTIGDTQTLRDCLGLILALAACTPGTIDEAADALSSIEDEAAALLFGHR